MDGRYISAAICAAALVSNVAMADELFVDALGMTRQGGGKDVPAILPMGEALTAAPMPFFHRSGPQAYQPSLAPLASAAGMQVMTGYSSAGNVLSEAVRGRTEGEDGSVTGLVRHDSAGTYRTPSDNRVDASYERDTEYVNGNIKLTPNVQVQAFALRDSVYNMALPNYGVDAPTLEQDAIGTSVAVTKLTGVFDQAKGGVSFGRLYADSDNYTLRKPSSVKLRFIPEKQAWSSSGMLSRGTRNGAEEIGADVAFERLISPRYSQEYGDGTFSSMRFPRVETFRTGVFANHHQDIDHGKVEVGVRYDAVMARATAQDEVPQIPGAAGATYNYSSRELYNRYYGSNRDTNPVQHLVSGRLRGEHEVAEDTSGYVDLSHMMRAPDALERFWSTSGGQALGQVGNPGLDPERHYRAEMGAIAGPSTFKGYGRLSPPGAWRVTVSAVHDTISDFITVDRAHGQAGIFQNDGVVIFRNVDARLSKLSLDAQATVADGWAVRANIAGERGRNLTDDRPLYQVAPFEANLFIDMFGGEGAGAWNAGLHSRLVAAQHSVDDSTATGSGIDNAGPAAPFAVFDVYGGLRVTEAASVVVGVDNLLNRQYRETIGFFPLQPSTTSVYAPGRTFFARGVMAF
jgi:iron complex outermembrane recepter protein